MEGAGKPRPRGGHGKRRNKMKTYKLAFALESGDFDVVSEFQARNNDSANHKAAFLTKRDHPARVDDWYVLNEEGENINAGNYR